MDSHADCIAGDGEVELRDSAVTEDIRMGVTAREGFFEANREPLGIHKVLPFDLNERHRRDRVGWAEPYRKGFLPCVLWWNIRECAMEKKDGEENDDGEEVEETAGVSCLLDGFDGEWSEGVESDLDKVGEEK